MAAAGRAAHSSAPPGAQRTALCSRTSSATTAGMGQPSPEDQDGAGSSSPNIPIALAPLPKLLSQEPTNHWASWGVLEAQTQTPPLEGLGARRMPVWECQLLSPLLAQAHIAVSIRVGRVLGGDGPVICHSED